MSMMEDVDLLQLIDDLALSIENRIQSTGTIITRDIRVTQDLAFQKEPEKYFI